MISRLQLALTTLPSLANIHKHICYQKRKISRAVNPCLPEALPRVFIDELGKVLPGEGNPRRLRERPHVSELPRHRAASESSFMARVDDLRREADNLARAGPVWREADYLTLADNLALG